MAVHFICFGDGSTDLRAAAQRLAAQASETGWFDSTEAWHVDDLLRTSATWATRHMPFMLENRRGFGYWIWKPFMIFERLKRIQMGDFLVAVDAGYEISPAGKTRFAQYIEMSAAYELLGFEIDEKIGKWTKGDLLRYLDVDLASPLLQDKQIQSGLLLVRKNCRSLLFFNHWSELAVACDYSLINDAPSLHSNPPDFAEHRHDQAILTLLARMGNYGYYPASEDYHPDLIRQGKFLPGYPFQCFRNKTGNRFIPAAVGISGM